MKRVVIAFSITVFCFVMNINFSKAQGWDSSRESFNKGWIFLKLSEKPTDKELQKGNIEDYNSPFLKDDSWRMVDLPHDWAIEGPFSDSLENNTGLLPWKGIGWYRKHFIIDENDKGKRFYIDFDGAMANSQVWLNGKYVGGWPYGYTSFRLDLTPYINAGGENVIAVRLDTKNWDSRWYPGAGIYRNVWLVRKSQVHLAYNGIFCTTPEITKERGMLSVEAEAENHLDQPALVTVKAVVFKAGEITGRDNKPVSDQVSATATVPASSTHRFRLDIEVKNPALWNLDDPELYKVAVTLRDRNEISDSDEAVFGFRTVDFTARDGLYLNGKRIRIQGVCNHHDLGALGAAFNIRAAERQLEILKEMGCNAIRTSHNPPAPELPELCDRMGFLMEVEAFDTWRINKKPLDYSVIFDAWHEEDLRSMVRRDRNHPSVIIWSIGNEVPDQSNPWLAQNLRSIVKKEDNTRPVTAGCDNPASGTSGFQKSLDIFGINYRLGSYDKFFESSDNANLGFHSSESASTVSSRGEYFFPVVTGDLNNNLPGKGIFQITSYDVAYPEWASTPDQQWTMLDKYPAAYGEFVWTGFDYLGEPTPFSGDLSDTKPGTWGYEITKKMLDKMGATEVPSRSSYFGIIDLAGFPKDRYYLYQSRWRPDLPMAHILPHWNWPERKGKVTPVHVYTSGDEAELFLNGKSLGRKAKGRFEYRLIWDDVVYQPGELKVTAYRNGTVWAEDKVVTPGSPFKLSAVADRAVIRADGNNLVFITVRIEDKKGNLVPRSINTIRFSISGPGKIAATDNGDATSHVPFRSDTRKAFNGLCLVIVKADGKAEGSFSVKAESKGLKASFMNIDILK